MHARYVGLAIKRDNIEGRYNGELWISWAIRSHQIHSCGDTYTSDYLCSVEKVEYTCSAKCLIVFCQLLLISGVFYVVVH
jgi:hypothetical protein